MQPRRHIPSVAELWRSAKMKITDYTIDRYDEVLVLMQKTPGVSIRDADSREATARYQVASRSADNRCQLAGVEQEIISRIHA